MEQQDIYSALGFMLLLWCSIGSSQEPCQSLDEFSHQPKQTRLSAEMKRGSLIVDQTALCGGTRNVLYLIIHNNPRIIF